MRRTRVTRLNPDDAWNQLENVSGWIRHADTKLATNIAFAGVAGGLLLSLVPPRPSWQSVALASLAGVFLAISLFAALFGLLPRRGKKSDPPRSLIFYRSIVKQYTDDGAYARAFLSSPSRVRVDVAKQVFATASVADRKFALASVSTKLLMAGLAALAVIAIMRVSDWIWAQQSLAQLDLLWRVGKSGRH